MIYEAIQRQDGKWYWHIKGDNGEIVVSSEVLEDDPSEIMFRVAQDAESTKFRRVDRTAQCFEMGRNGGWKEVNYLADVEPSIDVDAP